MKRFLHCRRGTTAVEFAIVVIPFLLFVFGTVEFGRLIWTQTALQFAVEKAARCASINTLVCGTPSQDPSQLRAYAAQQMLAPNVPPSAFSYTAASCGNEVSAQVAYSFLPEILPASATITLAADSCHPA